VFDTVRSDEIGGRRAAWEDDLDRIASLHATPKMS
jgi:hypothetical protein